MVACLCLLTLSALPAQEGEAARDAVEAPHAALLDLKSDLPPATAGPWTAHIWLPDAIGAGQDVSLRCRIVDGQCDERPTIDSWPLRGQRGNRDDRDIKRWCERWQITEQDQELHLEAVIVLSAKAKGRHEAVHHRLHISGKLQTAKHSPDIPLRLKELSVENRWDPPLHGRLFAGALNSSRSTNGVDAGTGELKSWAALQVAAERTGFWRNVARGNATVDRVPQGWRVRFDADKRSATSTTELRYRLPEPKATTDFNAVRIRYQASSSCGDIALLLADQHNIWFKSDPIIRGTNQVSTCIIPLHSCIPHAGFTDRWFLQTAFINGIGLYRPGCGSSHTRTAPRQQAPQLEILECSLIHLPDAEAQADHIRADFTDYSGDEFQRHISPAVFGIDCPDHLPTAVSDELLSSRIGGLRRQGTGFIAADEGMKIWQDLIRMQGRLRIPVGAGLISQDIPTRLLQTWQTKPERADEHIRRWFRSLRQIAGPEAWIDLDIGSASTSWNTRTHQARATLHHRLINNLKAMNDDKLRLYGIGLRPPTGHDWPALKQDVQAMLDHDSEALHAISIVQGHTSPSRTAASIEVLNAMMTARNTTALPIWVLGGEAKELRSQGNIPRFKEERRRASFQVISIMSILSEFGQQIHGRTAAGCFRQLPGANGDRLALRSLQDLRGERIHTSRPLPDMPLVACRQGSKGSLILADRSGQDRTLRIELPGLTQDHLQGIRRLFTQRNNIHVADDRAPTGQIIDGSLHVDVVVPALGVVSLQMINLPEPSHEWRHQRRYARSSASYGMWKLGPGDHVACTVADPAASPSHLRLVATGLQAGEAVLRFANHNLELPASKGVGIMHIPLPDDTDVASFSIQVNGDSDGCHIWSVGFDWSQRYRLQGKNTIHQRQQSTGTPGQISTTQKTSSPAGNAK